VAKRVRGNRSAAYKPGGQGPSRSKEPESSDAASSSVDVNAAIDDVASDTVLETTEIAIEEAAPTPRKRKTARRSARAKSESLAGRAAAEESWVREDLRNIGIITAILVVGLIVAWIAFVPLNLANLY
jgi:hypothetical protein